MNIDKLRLILDVGEHIAVEFKRCGNGITSDVYETVSSFLNRFGGDLFLGVENDGTVYYPCDNGSQGEYAKVQRLWLNCDGDSGSCLIGWIWYFYKCAKLNTFPELDFEYVDCFTKNCSP